jgi:intergrase/recombinase
MEKGKEKQNKYFDRQSRKLKRQAISFQCVLRVIQGGLLVRLLKSWVFDLTWSKSMEEDIIEFIYVRPQSSYLYKGYLSLRLPQLSDADESLTDESIDEPAKVDAMGGQ